MNIYNDFHCEIDAIWSQFEDLEECKIPPLCPKTAISNAILIIGLNPSLDKATEEELIEEREKGFIRKWLGYPQHESDKIHKYFRRFKELSENTGYEWSHVDLLFFRKTDSKSVKMLWQKEKEGKEFIEAQLTVSTKIIKALKPKIIVVNNAFGCQLLKSFQEKGKYTISTFNPDIGTYYFDETIPIFFSSMIEGPSPMDNGTFERLKWHIKSILDGKLSS